VVLGGVIFCKELFLKVKWGGQGKGGGGGGGGV
jgi:hypothetical protein